MMPLYPSMLLGRHFNTFSPIVKCLCSKGRKGADQNKKGSAFVTANPSIFAGSPNGNRTRVSGVRGRYPRPLDDGTDLAGGRGFEPRFAGPEPAVLPLNDPPDWQIVVLSMFSLMSSKILYLSQSTQRAQRVFSYFFSLRGRKEINPSPSGRVSTDPTLSGTHRNMHFIDMQPY